MASNNPQFTTPLEAEYQSSRSSTLRRETPNKTIGEIKATDVRIALIWINAVVHVAREWLPDPRPLRWRFVQGNKTRVAACILPRRPLSCIRRRRQCKGVPVRQYGEARSVTRPAKFGTAWLARNAVVRLLSARLSQRAATASMRADAPMRHQRPSKRRNRAAETQPGTCSFILDIDQSVSLSGRL